MATCMRGMNVLAKFALALFVLSVFRCLLAAAAHVWSIIGKSGQNRAYTSYMVVCMVTFPLLGLPCMHRTYVGLATTIYIYTVKYGVYARFWPNLLPTGQRAGAYLQGICTGQTYQGAAIIAGNFPDHSIWCKEHITAGNCPNHSMWCEEHVMWGACDVRSISQLAIAQTTPCDVHAGSA